MSRLTLSLFGPPLIELDGSPVTTDTRKAVALLAYLAMTRQNAQPRYAGGITLAGV